MVKKLPLFLTNQIGWKLLFKTVFISLVFLFAYTREFSFFPTLILAGTFLFAYISDFDDRRKYKTTFLTLAFCSFLGGKLVLFGAIPPIFSWVLFGLFFLSFFILFADVRVLFAKRDTAMFTLHTLTLFLTIFIMFLGIVFSVPLFISTTFFVIFLFLFPFFLFREYTRNMNLIWRGRIRVLGGVFGLVLVEMGLSMFFLPIPGIFVAVLLAGTGVFIEQAGILHLEGKISKQTVFFYMFLFALLWGVSFFFTSVL